MKPAPEPLPVTLARVVFWLAATIILVVMVLQACGCGPVFTLAVDAGELAMSSPGDDDAHGVRIDAPPAADAGGDLIPDAPSGDREDVVFTAPDAGDLIPDAPTGDAPSPPPGCSASTDCPVCPGTPAVFACCHGGRCGCVPEGIACAP